jgi:hypothetical protein
VKTRGDRAHKCNRRPAVQTTNLMLDLSQLAPEFSVGPRSAPIVKWIRIVGIYCKSHFSLVQQIQLPPRRKTQEAMTVWSC